jgi:uncharacterized protein YbjT (DUF2867 family)
MVLKPVLVTGATGYVGGRLVPLLLASGWRVRAMGRSLDKLAARDWAGHPNAELVQGDTLDLRSLVDACTGCRAAYYLVHSMISGKGRFADADRTSALHMAAAAEAGGLERIVYLSGLGDPDDPSVSKHLLSRYEVEAVLQAGAVPTTVLRAAMILGSGSASFEILRYLVERLPVMVTPRWVQTPCEPISITSVLHYLKGSLENDATTGETFDIGDHQVLTYADIIAIYAEAAGLSKRRIIPVPVLTPRLSSYWIHLVTPVPASIAQPLARGLAVPVICRDHRIDDLLPHDPPSVRDTVHLALRRHRDSAVQTCWTDAGCMPPPEWAVCGDAEWAGGTLMQCGYRVRVRADAHTVWRPVTRIGGKTGYYYANGLWRLRGLLDRLAGGTGLRRGRRHSEQLRAGDVVDFWRVLEAAPPRRLRLLAEMKMPGSATLDIALTPAGSGATDLEMLSRFEPRGLLGLLYWYSLYPFHELIFYGMLKAMARSVSAPVAGPPRRFTPRVSPACRLEND